MVNKSDIVYKVSGHCDFLDRCLDNDLCSIYDNIHYESDCEDFVDPEFIFSSKQPAIVRFNDYKKKYFQMLYYAFVDNKKLLADEDIPDLSVLDNGESITYELADNDIYREDGYKKVVCYGCRGISKYGDDNEDIGFGIRLESEDGEDTDIIASLLLVAQPKTEYKDEKIIKLSHAESEYGPQQSFIMGSIKEDDMVEPIEWIFVRKEDDKALVVSKKGLFIKPYDDKVTEDGKHPWNKSTLRKWLNTEFYDKCFSDKEKEKILFCEDEEENIHEKIFLLSAADVVSDFPRLWICEPCELLAPNVYCECENRLSWFLRDIPNYKQYGNHYKGYQIIWVYAADAFGYSVDETTMRAVRPAMWIRLK